MHHAFDRFLTILCPGIVALFVCLSSAASYAVDVDNIPKVVVSEVQISSLDERLSFVGTVTSKRVSNIAPQISGQVKKLFVDEGDYVKAGETILEIDNELELLTYKSLLATTEQARAEVNDAKRRYENAKELLKKAVISTNDVDSLRAEVEIDNAFLQRQIEQENRSRALLKRYTLKAPFAGVISNKSTEVGEWVSSENAVFTIVSLEDLRAEFRVPQENYRFIKKNAPITLTFDAWPNRELNSLISTIIPVSDFNARTLLIHATINTKDLDVIPGMSTQGDLQLGSKEDRLVISRDAIIRYPNRSTSVWVVTESGQTKSVTEKFVTTGYSFNNKVVIENGLQAGEIIVVRGNELLTEGQVVHIQRN
jgi:RND family efflux transporter MFP subunit